MTHSNQVSFDGSTVRARGNHTTRVFKKSKLANSKSRPLTWPIASSRPPSISRLRWRPVLASVYGAATPSLRLVSVPQMLEAKSLHACNLQRERLGIFEILPISNV